MEHIVCSYTCDAPIGGQTKIGKRTAYPTGKRRLSSTDQAALQKYVVADADGCAEPGGRERRIPALAKMTELKLLPSKSLYRPCDITQFKFETTADLQDLTEAIGQDRALQALQFGIGIRRQGFNLFLLGPAGIGKYAVARTLLEKRAATEPTPD